MKPVPISINKAVKDMTLHVKITGQLVFPVRLRVGVWLLRLGCKVIGCNIVLKQDWDNGDKPERSDK